VSRAILLFVLTWFGCQGGGAPDTGRGGALQLEYSGLPSSRYATTTHHNGEDVTILLIEDRMTEDCRAVLLVDEGRRGIVLLDAHTFCDTTNDDTGSN
jgi:hypothetical protein